MVKNYEYNVLSSTWIIDKYMSLSNTRTLFKLYLLKTLNHC
jgi:hypothetical protein